MCVWGGIVGRLGRMSGASEGEGRTTFRAKLIHRMRGHAKRV